MAARRKVTRRRRTSKRRRVSKKKTPSKKTKIKQNLRFSSSNADKVILASNAVEEVSINVHFNFVGKLSKGKKLLSKVIHKMYKREEKYFVTFLKKVVLNTFEKMKKSNFSFYTRYISRSEVTLWSELQNTQKGRRIFCHIFSTPQWQALDLEFRSYFLKWIT